jgi:signal transduction histidine kinase
LIEIQTERLGETIRLRVQDDGPGIENDNPESLAKGIGLTNTRARLEHLYGSAHRFELQNGNEGGLSATVIIPFREESEKANSAAKSIDR